MANSRMVTLHASGAETASGTFIASGVGTPLAASFFLDVTAAATDGTDTFNVYIQRTPDNGTTWDDLVAFTAIDGTATTTSEVAHWTSKVTPERELGAEQDGALSAGVLQGGVISHSLRAKWVIVSGNSASFTFSLKMVLEE